MVDPLQVRGEAAIGNFDLAEANEKAEGFLESKQRECGSHAIAPGRGQTT